MADAGMERKERSRSAAQSYLTLRPRGLQHTRLPCPSPSPRVCSNSCPLSRWCHPTSSSSVALFFSCPQSFPSLESFPMNQLLTSGGQSIGASASAPILPVNIEGWFPLGLIGLISCVWCVILLKLFFIRLAWSSPTMPSNHLILYCPVSSWFQSFPASASFLMS